LFTLQIWLTKLPHLLINPYDCNCMFRICTQQPRVGHT
jgi:hypothetical protein